MVNKFYEYNGISKKKWIEILQDKNVITDAMKAILNIVYYTEHKKLNAKAIADALGYKHFAQVNKLVGNCGRRIIEIYDISETRELGNNGPWFAVFDGEEVRVKSKVTFNWILKKNMIAAIEQLQYFKLPSIKNLPMNGTKEFDNQTILPEEISITNIEELTEGAKKQIIVNAYERNNTARRLCLEYYGHTCCVCQFDFGRFYGAEFEGKIHVHHLKALSEINSEYVIDPINDLRPVCPNCHLALHSKKGKVPYTIEELKKKIEKA